MELQLAPGVCFWPRKHTPGAEAKVASLLVALPDWEHKYWLIPRMHLGQAVRGSIYEFTIHQFIVDHTPRLHTSKVRLLTLYSYIFQMPVLISVLHSIIRRLRVK